MNSEPIREAFLKWNELQAEQAATQKEGNRLGIKADKMQDDIEAIENEWRNAWSKLGLY